MKKLYLWAISVLALLPLFATQVCAAGGHVAAGVANYPLIIACVVGGSLVVFLLAMFAMKYKRNTPESEENTEEENRE